MSFIAARELRNHTADLIERARKGEEITITVNGVPSALLIALPPSKRAFLTHEDLRKLMPKPGAPVAEPWEHELEGDTTDELRDFS